MELITDIEAEQRVLSCILHSDTACAEVLTAISENEFSRQLHQDIFNIAKNLYKRGVKPGRAEIMREGMGLGLIKTAQDTDEIAHIAQQYIDDENLFYWQDRVKKAAKGRKAQNLIRQYSHEIQGKKLDVDKFISRAGTDFMQLAMDSETERIETGADLAEYGKAMVIANVEKWRRQQEEAKNPGEAPLEGVPTGLKKLDNLTMGYKPGDLIIMGAQTGHGKTAFALNTASAVCVDDNKPLFYVNTEMSKKQVSYRMAAILSQLELQKIRAGALSNEEINQVNTCYDLLACSAFHFCNIPNLTPDKLQTMAQKAKLQYGTELLILDYVGRMEKRDPKYQEWQVLEDIVKACKIMAQNLEMAVMVLVQLNEDGSLQGAKRMKNECDVMLKLFPMCDDLKDADELQAAQNKYQNKYKKAYEPFNYRLWVDKSRDSESGLSIPLVFDLERQQIREAQVLDKIWK